MINTTSNETVLKRAKSATCLDHRIGAYAGSQGLDLNEWIFSGIHAPLGGTVLELCCGTGMQTIRLASQVGTSGRVIVVDASLEALNKMSDRCATQLAATIIPIQGELDDLSNLLDQQGVVSGSLEMCFCAYGLYYAKNVQRVLDIVLDRLSPSGALIVVGPYGRNNYELYDLLEAAGVSISEYVLYTSRDFMPLTLIPRLADDFSTMTLRTTCNEVVWPTVEDVLSYWRNTTFYDQAKEPTVSDILKEHFAVHGKFINRKWIMSVTASTRQVK